MCTSVTCQWPHTDALLSPSREETPGQGGCPLLRTLTAASQKAFPEKVCHIPSLCVEDTSPFQHTKAPIWTRVTPALRAATTAPTDRKAEVGFWAWGDRAGLLRHPMPGSLQDSALASVDPSSHRPSCAGVVTALQVVMNQAPGAVGWQGEGAACAHRGARPVMTPTWCTPDPSPGSPSPWSCWLGGITPGWKGPSPPPGLQRAR